MEVTQRDIVPDGFVLRWSTNIGRSPQVAFRCTPALRSFASDSHGGTTHQVVLMSLILATFYYRRAFSIARGGTAW